MRGTTKTQDEQMDYQGLSVESSSYVFFFFSSRRRHTRLQGDWSSDVCSSDYFTYGTGGAAMVATADPRPRSDGGSAMSVRARDVANRVVMVSALVGLAVAFLSAPASAAVGDVLRRVLIPVGDPATCTDMFFAPPLEANSPIGTSVAV